MPAPDGSPPAFRLPDGCGQTAVLADFLGRRIALVFSPGFECLETLSANADGLNERDMVVLIILPTDHPLSSKPTAPPVWILNDQGSRVATAYGVPASRPFFCLIGKDGTIKQSGPAVPTPAELFKTVDAMPMRRQEMREMRERGGEGRG